MSRRRSSSRVAACAAATTPALSPQRSKPAGAAPELRKSRPERDELQDKNMPNNSFGESSCTAAASGLVQVRGARENNLKERSEEHTSELQSLMRISYAVFCLKKKNQYHYNHKPPTHAYQH